MSGLDVASALDLLRHGDITVEGRLVDASNATLLCRIATAGSAARCVYKPVAGERPLWDFPDGTLAGREVAAHAVSAAGGWGIVPPTVLREGPFGRGMCQLWVEHDDSQRLVDVLTPREVPDDWRQVLDALGSGGQRVVLAHADDPRLRAMAVLDVVLNNADRKGGHVLPSTDGVLHGVDHGVSFHVEPKLRTVLWGWAGEDLTPQERTLLDELRESLVGPLGAELSGLLSPSEVRATRGRVDRLLRDGHLPFPAEGWPAIPWPPF